MSFKTVARCVVGVFIAGVVTTGTGGTASANHPHYLGLPNGNTVEVARGSTSQTSGAACHKFHEHVHLGGTEGSAHPDNLGDGHSRVTLTKTGVTLACTP